MIGKREEGTGGKGGYIPFGATVPSCYADGVSLVVAVVAVEPRPKTPRFYSRLRNDKRNTRWSSGINAIACRLRDRLVIELSRHLLFLVEPCSDLYRALKSTTIPISCTFVLKTNNRSEIESFYSKVR